MKFVPLKVVRVKFAIDGSFQFPEKKSAETDYNDDEKTTHPYLSDLFYSRSMYAFD